MKKMMLAICGLVVLQFSGIAQKTINDPNAEVRAAKGFHAVEISSAFDVYLTQSNEESVAVSASETEFRNNIKTDVKDGVLIIKYQSKKWSKGNQKLKAYISFKNLDRLMVSGACDVIIVDNWKEENLKINVSGASNLKGKLQVSKLMIDVSGASDLRLTGTVGQLDVGVSGASKLLGQGLDVEYCDAKVSGASEIEISVSKELSANASGASQLRYSGKGVITDIKTSGASRIKKT